MTDAELVFTALAELSTRQIAETMEAKGLDENKIPAKKGGRIAKNARLELEQKTGRKIVNTFGYKYNQSTILPNFITHITFGLTYNQPTILPNSITHLTFEYRCNQETVLWTFSSAIGT